MSKRGASVYITKDGLHDMQGQDDAPAQRATAAQLANRKIAQARGRSGARTRPGATSQMSGFSSSGGFGATSQSFPPTNPSPSLGNGSANASFGDFGSGGSSFNFSAGGGFNNPFAQQNEPPATNGVSNGGISFNFGSGPAQTTATPFSFGSQSQKTPQQPAQNLFGVSQSQPSTGLGGFATSQQQPSNNLFGTAVSQPTTTSNLFAASTLQSSQPAAGGFGGFGATASAPATTAPTTFGVFGATASQPQQTVFGGFGQPAAQPSSTTAPAFGGFGREQSPPALGQVNGDAMMSTPEASPQKQPFGWNKQTPNGIASAPNTSGAESPDRPPHVEQTEDTPRPNVFADITRPPPKSAPAPKVAGPKPASTGLFNFSKPIEPENSQEPEKQQEKEKENEPPSLFTPEKEAASAPNPFASIQQMPASKEPSLFSSPSQAEKPKASTSSFFPLSSATQQTAAPAKPFLFNPSTTLSTPPKPAKTTATIESLPQKPSASSEKQPWGGWGSRPQETPSWPKPSQAAETPQPAQEPVAAPFLGTSAYMQLLPEVLREDNLPAPGPQQDLNEEEKRLYYQALKIDRLNKAFEQNFTRMPKTTDLSPLFNDYIAFMVEIKKGTAGSRLADLLNTYGQVEGQKRYDQEQGRLPLDGTNKRKAAPLEDEENEKRAKTDGDVPQSDTASKFQSILEQSGQKSTAAPATNNLFGASTATPTPSKTGNLFSQAAASPALPPTKNLFGNTNAPPSAASTTSSLFGNASAAASSTPAKSNAASLFSKDALTTTAPPASIFGGFKPSTSLTATDSNKAPTSAFGGFKPVLSSSSSTSSSVPKFGSGSTNFLSQFSKNAEEEAKKAKEKAFEEDYDSEEETKEQWEARYEKEQEEKRKKIAATSSVGGFKFTPTSSLAGSNAGSGDEAEPRGTSGFLSLPAAGSAFSAMSRSASPTTAASPAGSVFDQPRSSTPGGTSKDNPFAHFSRQASEKGDADDEDESADGDEQSLEGETAEEDQEEEEDEGSTPKAPNGVVKRPGPFEEDSEESQPETPKQRTDGLFGRITRDTPGDRTPLATTGANSGSLFSTAASASQIWTPKDPIKFAPNNASTEEEKSAAKPKFSFTPVGGSQAPQGVFSGLFSGTQGSATPSGASTPFNPFASLATPTPKPGSTTSLFPPSGAVSAFSTPGFNSRATTPGISDMSGAESTAGEGEEAKPDTQIDIADMSKDKEGHEVIFESAKVKATKYEKGDAKNTDGEDGDKPKTEGWHVVGVGPIAVLKNEESGIVSMLMRTTPSGRVIINTRVASVLSAQVMSKRARFMIVKKEGVESYLVGFQTADDCKTFVEALKANGAK